MIWQARRIVPSLTTVPKRSELIWQTRERGIPLILGKVDEIAEKSGSILGGRRDMGRSRSGDRCRTGRTADFGQTVFRHLKAGRGKIKDLPSFMAHDREMGEIFSAGAACHGNLHDRVGSFHPQEGVSFVAGLASGFLS